MDGKQLNSKKPFKHKIYWVIKNLRTQVEQTG